MRLVLRAIVVGAAVLIPACAMAQQASPSQPEGGALELRRQAPPIVAPVPQSPEAIGEAERAVKELERQQREEQLLREATPRPPRRPDLDYDVKSGIQQKAIRNALPR